MSMQSETKKITAETYEFIRKLLRTGAIKEVRFLDYVIDQRYPDEQKVHGIGYSSDSDIGFVSIFDEDVETALSFLEDDLNNLSIDDIELYDDGTLVIYFEPKVVET